MSIKAHHLLLLVTAALFVGGARSQSTSEVRIQTTLGPIIGRDRVASNGKKVVTFFGVPFGKAPVDDLRFAPPQPADPWTTPKHSDKMAFTCFYTLDELFGNFEGSQMWNGDQPREDCLQLNIWKPTAGDFDGTVLVWIYGGGFFSGSPSLKLYDAIELTAHADVIVVNINYRLGPFGFMYLGADSLVPGNMGLLDQQLALRWVHENIANLGGDPDKVTLFGESAGADSASAHLLSATSRKYFRHVILNSGTVLNPWASSSPEQMERRSTALAQRAGCGGTYSVEMVRCLQSKTAHQIQEAADKEQNVRFMEFPFVPVSADRNFFAGDVCERLSDVRTALADGRHAVLLGSVADEGSYWLPYFMAAHGFTFDHTIPADSDGNLALINRRQYEGSVNATFAQYLRPGVDVRRTLQTIAKAYYHDSVNATLSDRFTDRRRMRNAVAQFVGDFFFTCDLVRYAQFLREHNVPVYMYYFTQRSSANPWPKWMGVMHGYEIEYAFGQPMRTPTNYSRNGEMDFSRRIIKMWTDFARTGVPAGNDWPPYGKKDECVILDETTTRRSPLPLAGDIFQPHCQLLNRYAQVVTCDKATTSNATQGYVAIWICAVIAFTVLLVK